MSLTVGDLLVVLFKQIKHSSHSQAPSNYLNIPCEIGYWLQKQEQGYLVISHCQTAVLGDRELAKAHHIFPSLSQAGQLEEEIQVSLRGFHYLETDVPTGGPLNSLS